MPRFVAFLRAVNVGERRYPMAELRSVLTEAGYADVETHIQTGNVLLGAATRSPARIRSDLERIFLADRGFEVPTVVFTSAELSALAREADAVVAEYGEPAGAHYLELLDTVPDEESRALIEDQPPGQRAVLRGRAVHLLYDMPFHRAKPASAAQRRAMGTSTNRNARVIRTLAARWGA